MIHNLKKKLKYKGISGFISQPHYLNADTIFLENVDGLNPNETEHDTIMQFEPVSLKHKPPRPF